MTRAGDWQTVPVRVRATHDHPNRGGNKKGNTAMTDRHVTTDIYKHTPEEHGLWERDIECSECGDPIGAHEYDTESTTVEFFWPYFMCDPDNNDNVCEDCYKTRTVELCSRCHDAIPAGQEQWAMADRLCPGCFSA